MGGSAGCHRYKPKLVHCENVGFDGYDAQVGVVKQALHAPYFVHEASYISELINSFN